MNGRHFPFLLYWEHKRAREENQEEKENTPLSTKISQARAIEYIINYRLKRNDLPTGKIRVLELQPARSQGEIRVHRY